MSVRSNWLIVLKKYSVSSLMFSAVVTALTEEDRGIFYYDYNFVFLLSISF
jgi:hypothetical protein